MSTRHPSLMALRFPVQASVLGVIFVLTLAEGGLRFIVGFFSVMSLGTSIVLAWIVIVLVVILMAVTLIQYSSVVFHASAMGEHKVRILDATDVAPFSTPILVRVTVLTLTLAAIATAVGPETGTTARGVAVIAAALLLPGVLSVLVLSGSLSLAVSPASSITLMREMGWRYLLLPLVSVAVIAAIAWLAYSNIAWPLRSILMGYVYFLSVHILGRIIFASRDRIGLAVTRAPEIDALAKETQAHEQHARMLEHAYQKSLSSTDDALGAITSYLHGENDNLATREWLFDRLALWADTTCAIWFANDLVSRQIRMGETDKALRIAAWCLERNPAFRPKGANETRQLADAARHNGRNFISTALLSDFAQRFPDSPHKVPALLLCAKIAIEKTNERALARRIIDSLENDALPADDPRVVALRKLASS